jgi:phosphonoacetaldehyde hydrolase
MPLQITKVGEYSTLIPGALESITALREADLKIGSTSGYPKKVMDKLVLLATDEVLKGRPSPAQV